MPDKLDKFDETDLLAFIEDQLDPERAAEIRRFLAGDRETLALLEQMQDDRRMLQSMDEPVVPADLLAELEPMMARPMLMPDPGDWRRRYRRRRPWKRYAAVAAIVCMALLAGIWASTSGLIGFGRSTGSTLALTDGAIPIVPDIARAEATGADQWPPPETVIHHRAPGIPGATDSAEKMVTAVRPAPDRRRLAPGEAPTLTAVQFVLVVTSRGDDDERGIEQTLQRVLEEVDGETALVRNFSFQEARHIAQRLRVEQGRALDRDLARARDDFAGMAAMAGSADRSPRDLVDLPRRRRAAGRLARTLEKSGGPLRVSGQLLGPRSLAPTYEQQLEYADRGAIWTITVPADCLNDVLARLQVTEGRVTALQAWDATDALDDAAAVRSTAADRWLKDYPRILREAAELSGTVMLPVVIRPAGE